MTLNTLKYTLVLFCLLFIQSGIQAANPVQTVATVSSNLVLDKAVDYHITATTNAVGNATINITHEDARLFFDNIKPSLVQSAYGSKIKINGKTLNHDVTGRITIYQHGTVIVPHAVDYTPLTVYSERDYGGDKASYRTYYHYKTGPENTDVYQPIGAMDDKIRSFKLKRGYMACLGNNPNMMEFSKIFIADKEDLLVPRIQAELDQSVSYIRVMPWNYVTKKGLASGDTGRANKLNCTWYYDWAAGNNSTLDLDYVPERHNRWWDGYHLIANRRNVSHAIHFNEPDHPEQHEGTALEVSLAIEQWPEFMRSGLRLGSPATTDFNWLYAFIDECDRRNYRVDFIVIHAYWGGLSPSDWYNQIKAVSDRCGGRPVWIKEWNNGAGWTNEWWPESWEAKLAKQKMDIEAILNVFDNADFIERYSIFEVDDKLHLDMIVFDKAHTPAGWANKMTPAGEVYRDNRSKMAYTGTRDISFVWKAQAPVIETIEVLKEGGVSLQWSNPNGGLATEYKILRKAGGGDYETIATLPGPNPRTYVDKTISLVGGTYSYKVAAVVLRQWYESKEKVLVQSLGQDDVQYGFIGSRDFKEISTRFSGTFTQVPKAIIGAASFNNNMAFTYTLSSMSKNTIGLRFTPWTYQSTATFNKDENLPFLVASSGKHRWGSIDAQVASVNNVTGAWVKVNFAEAFNRVPVVIPTVASNNSQLPMVAQVRNVTEKGFEVRVRKEAGQTNAIARESVNYIAATCGKGMIGGKYLEVGRTTQLNSVGGYFDSGKITYGQMLYDPVVFAATQTVQDEAVAVMRYHRKTDKDVLLLRYAEESKGNVQQSLAKETVGYMLLEAGAKPVSIDRRTTEGWRVFPVPADDVLFVSSPVDEIYQASIYDLSGTKMMDVSMSDRIDVSQLLSGVYILRINGLSFRFVKK